MWGCAGLTALCFLGICLLQDDSSSSYIFGNEHNDTKLSRPH